MSRFGHINTLINNVGVHTNKKAYSISMMINLTLQ